MMESKIGNSELTGVAEGVQQKLDITDLVSKVILLSRFFMQLFFVCVAVVAVLLLLYW